MKYLARKNPTLLTAWLCLGVSLLFPNKECRAELRAYLSEARQSGLNQFEADLLFRGTDQQVGDEIEYIEIDLSQSTINSDPLLNFALVRFDTANPFDAWRQESFGQNPDALSRLVMEPFSPPGTPVFPIANTDAFRVGTFTFDYGDLRLQSGDLVKLDIRGTDDDTGVRTTAVGIRSAGISKLHDLSYTDPAGDFQSTFVVSAIPEPRGVAFIAITALGMVLRRRKN
ncbi:hypothetical protein LOC67_08150 [Stieleria sp. JC731]|uniref:hypothetical protein n=1 Tax=Pirellulaceae TaxID=2691357 RepID=UPI001E425657|nr:hypothetical protein [Stieleria sp. JC731]MCC9600530.1 hypothetical protein [Stieleria sp. JC731]